MKRDHVLVLAYQVGAIGGIQRYTRDLAWALTQNGYRVTILARNIDSERASFYSLITPPRRWSRFWLWWMQRQAHRTLEHDDTALIVAAHAGLGSLGHKLKCKFSLPFIVCTFGIEAWGEWNTTIACGLTNADRVVTISQFTAEKLRQRGLDQVTLLPVTVDTARYHCSEQRARKAPVLLTVARLASTERYKGHDFVIQCLPKLVDRFLGLQYRIVGSGDDQARLSELAASVGMRDRVVFLGQLSEDDLIAEYCAANVFVMLSETGQKSDGSWMGEGFGRVYLEAASCGCPVIAADGGGAREAVLNSESGYLIPARDEPAFVRTVTDLLGNKEISHEMGMAGRKFVETNFSSRVLVHQVSALMRELQKSDAN